MTDIAKDLVVDIRIMGEDRQDCLQELELNVHSLVGNGAEGLKHLWQSILRADQRTKDEDGSPWLGLEQSQGAAVS